MIGTEFFRKIFDLGFEPDLQCFVAQWIVSLHQDLISDGSNPRTVTRTNYRGTQEKK